jgi:hypothetical protein
MRASSCSFSCHSVQQLIELGKNPPKIDELQALKQLIKDLKERHSNHLEHLYACQAQDYLQEARDRYTAKDDSQHLVKGENNPTLKTSYGRLEARASPMSPTGLDAFVLSQHLYRETRRERAYVSEWDDEVDRLRVAHLKGILPLEERRAELEKLEEAARQRRDAQFPGSYQEYSSIPNKDVQLRVARFLVGDGQRQETIMTQFGWAWRQVQPLKDEYSRNVTSFIRAASLSDSPCSSPSFKLKCWSC